MTTCDFCTMPAIGNHRAWNYCAAHEPGASAAADAARPTVTRSRVSLPSVIGEQVRSVYPDGTVTEWQFCPVGGRMMFGVRSGADGAWGPVSTIADPERFGPVPTGVSRSASRALSAWVDAFLAAAD